MSIRICSLCFSIFFILSSNIAHSLPLEPRYGGQAFYDPDTNFTWYANANPIGAQSYDDANAWATSFELGGAVNWGIPGIVPYSGYDPVACASGNWAACPYHEFDTLFDYRGIRDNNPGLFANLESGYYWASNLAYNPYDPSYGRYKFSFDHTLISPSVGVLYDFYDEQVAGLGFTIIRHAGDVLYGLNVSEVPLPAAAWMFGSAVLGFMGLRRRKKLASL